MRLSILYRAVAVRRRLAAALAGPRPDPIAATFERQADLADADEEREIAALQLQAERRRADPDGWPWPCDVALWPPPNEAPAAASPEDPSMKTLIRYVLFPRGDRFVMQFTDEAGIPSEFLLTAAQLEALIDDADALLDDDGTLSPPGEPVPD